MKEKPININLAYQIFGFDFKVTDIKTIKDQYARLVKRPEYDQDKNPKDFDFLQKAYNVIKEYIASLEPRQDHIEIKHQKQPLQTNPHSNPHKKQPTKPVQNPKPTQNSLEKKSLKRILEGPPKKALSLESCIALIEKGEYRKALVELKTRVSHSLHQENQTLYYLALAHKEVEEYNAAKTQLNKILEQEPKNKEAEKLLREVMHLKKKKRKRK